MWDSYFHYISFCFFMSLLKKEGKYLSHWDRRRCLPEDVCCLENVGSLYNIWRYVIEWIVTTKIKRTAVLYMVYPSLCTVTDVPLIAKYSWFLQHFSSFVYEGFWIPWVTYVSRWDRFMSSNFCTFTYNNSGYILLRRKENETIMSVVMSPASKNEENSQRFVN